MRTFTLALLVLGTGCGQNVCNRTADLRQDCDDPISEVALGACRTTIRDCDSETIDAIDSYLDCLTEGVARGECVIPDPKDPTTDPSAGCFELVLNEDPACVAAVTSP
ncbi:MAG: hypothetical protein AAGA48_05220 [Myxococcota bacterium]